MAFFQGSNRNIYFYFTGRFLPPPRYSFRMEKLTGFKARGGVEKKHSTLTLPPFKSWLNGALALRAHLSRVVPAPCLHPCLCPLTPAEPRSPQMRSQRARRGSSCSSSSTRPRAWAAGRKVDFMFDLRSNRRCEPVSNCE